MNSFMEGHWRGRMPSLWGSPTGGGWDFSQFNEYLPRPEQAHSEQNCLFICGRFFLGGASKAHLQMMRVRYTFKSVHPDSNT